MAKNNMLALSLEDTAKKANKPKRTNKISTEVASKATKLNLPSEFEETYESIKNNNSKAGILWLTEENRDILETLKYRSKGKYNIKITANTILDIFFKEHGITADQERI